MTCVKVYVPNKVEYLRALTGSLDYLGTWVAWERDELKRGKDAAASWKIANELTNDTILEGCVELPPGIGIDEDGNIILGENCDMADGCTINIYCGPGSVVNGTDPGTDPGTGGPPPAPDPGAGLILVEPTAVLINNNPTPPSSLVLETESITDTAWLYGDLDSAVELTMGFFFSEYPGVFLGGLFIVYAMEGNGTTNGGSRMKVGHPAQTTTQMGDSVLPLKICIDNGLNATWTATCDALVTDEGYQKLAGSTVNLGKIELIKSVRGDGPLNPWSWIVSGARLCFTDPFG
jgi:hypothetical protein